MADETILIVEDNDILRDGYQFLLETEGYRVIPARHGQEALQQMQNATPDLILSDISMPEMDGYSFYDAVRARPDLAAIPFIFLTPGRA
jgi:CheY-like chemotaxis protein